MHGGIVETTGLLCNREGRLTVEEDFDEPVIIS